ncbi:MAG: rod shape-determining protein MreC [Oscillospiraceae bacterium]|nr:rod shape-determining protein MreC [Oscillospiraceae bacterium]
MREFFSSLKFKILVCVAVLLAGIMTYAAANGRLSNAPQELLNAVLVPVQRFSAAVSGGISGFFEKFAQADEIAAENERLEEEIVRLRQQLIEYDQYKAENEMYRKTLQLQEENRSFTQVSASVIGRDPLEKYYSFTIDQGENAGIEVNDVVICPEGVVGKVLETGPNYAKVITVLDPRVNIGCTVSRTRDIGTAAGTAELAQEGKLALSYLPRETLTTENDIVVTTGYGGIFPKGLILGTVEDVRPESSGKSMYAVLRPTVDISTITMVFVITDF